MNVVLYSNNCPKCRILTTKLEQKSISYEEVNDVDLMMRKRFTTVPMLEVDGVVYDFKQAVDFVNGYKENSHED